MRNVFIIGHMLIFKCLLNTLKVLLNINEYLSSILADLIT